MPLWAQVSLIGFIVCLIGGLVLYAMLTKNDAGTAPVEATAGAPGAAATTATPAAPAQTKKSA